MAPGTPRTPGTPGPPGTLQSAQKSANPTVSSATADSSSMVLRPSMPTGSVAVNLAVQPQIAAPYPSLPALAGPPQGLWLQNPQMGGVPRVPIVPYTATFPGSFPFVARGMHPIQIPDSQPPGVTPVENSGNTPLSSITSSHQLSGPSGMHTEVRNTGICVLRLSYT